MSYDEIRALARLAARVDAVLRGEYGTRELEEREQNWNRRRT